MPGRSAANRDAAYAHDIVESCRAIAAYTRHRSLEEFKTSPMLQDAVARRLFVIGEAAKNLSEALKAEITGIDWKNIARLRDKLGHHYWSIEIEKLWEIVVAQVPPLGAALERHPILAIRGSGRSSGIR